MTQMLKKKRKLGPNEIIPLWYDEAYKLMFGNEDYPEITAFLIATITGIDYKLIEDKIQLYTDIHVDDTLGNKKSKRDITLLLEHDNIHYKITMEMNAESIIVQTTIDRNVYYATNLHSHGLRESLDYDNLKTTIQYNFNDGYVDKESQELIDEYYLKNKHNHLLTDKIKFVQFNIAQMYKIWYDKNDLSKYDYRTKQIIYLSALLMTNKLDEYNSSLALIDTDEKIKKIMRRRIKEMASNEELVMKFFDYDIEKDRTIRGIKSYAQRNPYEFGYNIGWEEGHDAAREEARANKQAAFDLGIEQGIEQGQIKKAELIVKKMYDQGIKLSTISKCSEIPIEKLKHILNI